MAIVIIEVKIILDDEGKQVGSNVIKVKDMKDVKDELYVNSSREAKIVIHDRRGLIVKNI